MEQIYRHRLCLMNAGRTIYTFFGISIALCWLPLIISHSVPLAAVLLPNDLSFSLSITLFFSGILLLRFRSEFQSSCFIINSNEIIHRTPYKVTVIRFDEMLKVAVRFHFIYGRSICLFAKGKRIRLGFTIERLHSLLCAVESGLVLHGKRSVVDHSCLKEYKRWARTADVLVEKLFSGAATFIFYSLLFVAANAVIAGRFWMVDVVSGIVWTLAGTLFPLFWLAAYVGIYISQHRLLRSKRPRTGIFRSLDSAWLAGTITGAAFLISGYFFYR